MQLESSSPKSQSEASDDVQSGQGIFLKQWPLKFLEVCLLGLPRTWTTAAWTTPELRGGVRALLPGREIRVAFVVLKVFIIWLLGILGLGSREAAPWGIGPDYCFQQSLVCISELESECPRRVGVRSLQLFPLWGSRVYPGTDEHEPLRRLWSRTHRIPRSLDCISLSLDEHWKVVGNLTGSAQHPKFFALPAWRAAFSVLDLQEASKVGRLTVHCDCKA